MAPATYLSRTYSSKSTAKRKRASENISDVEQSDMTISGGRKRPRSHSSGQETVPASTPPPSKPRVARTYSSAKLRTPSPTLQVKSAGIVRDFSEVFESVTPSQSPVGTPRKLTRRMLARSVTESSLDPNSLRAPVMERTPSLPTLPSTPSRDKGKQKEVVEPDAALNPLLPLPLPTSNVTRTYAGKSRSFLVTVPASSLGPNSVILPHGMNVSIGDDEDDYLTRESYSSLRARWGVDNSEDDPYPVNSPDSGSKRPGSVTETPGGSPSRAGKGGKKALVPSISLPPNMMNPLKSITELRSKGENRRFLDEIGYMFEGMSRKGASSLRRTSALDIVTKLCDIEFARKAKVVDILGRTWDVFIEAGAGQSEDKILDLLLAFLAALIARDGASLAELAQRSSGSKDGSSKQHGSFVDTLFSILASSTSSPTSDLPRLIEAGDTELRKAGLSKKDHSQLILIYKLIATKSRLFPKDAPITTPLLITYTLQHLPPILIPTRHVPTLLDSLRASLSPLVSPARRTITGPLSKPSPSKPVSKTHSSPVASHVNWCDLATRIGFECVNAHLLLLDTYLLGQWEAPSDDDADNGEEDPKEDQLEQAKDEWLLEALVALGICSEIRLRNRRAGKAGECLELVLRILVSRTHAEESWGRAVLRNPYSMSFMLRLVAWTGDTCRELRKPSEGNGKDDDGNVETRASEDEVDETDSVGESRSHRDDEDIRWQDRLCLALALLANLAQSVDKAKDAVRETRVDPNCSLKKSACVRSCCCSRPLGGLDIIIRLYSQQETSRDGPSRNGTTDGDEREGEMKMMLNMLSLLGHLAVLFGLLMRENGRNTEIIISALPCRGESRKTKLGRLVEQARELVSFDAALGRPGEVAREIIGYLRELM